MTSFLHSACRRAVPSGLFKRSVQVQPGRATRVPLLSHSNASPRHSHFIVIMSTQKRGASSKRESPDPRPSSSVIILSPTNEVLLLHRVKTSTSFASAHVFPGGNLDPFHDGDIPAPESPERHRDGPAYRLGAVRECFEETGILLAKKNGSLVNLTAEERDAARKKIHNNEVKFEDFLKSIGAVPDTG